MAVSAFGRRVVVAEDVRMQHAQGKDPRSHTTHPSFHADVLGDERSPDWRLLHGPAACCCFEPDSASVPIPEDAEGVEVTIIFDFRRKFNVLTVLEEVLNAEWALYAVLTLQSHSSAEEQDHPFVEGEPEVCPEV